LQSQILCQVEYETSFVALIAIGPSTGGIAAKNLLSFLIFGLKQQYVGHSPMSFGSSKKVNHISCVWKAFTRCILVKPWKETFSYDPVLNYFIREIKVE
jgi:hypothetical protein